MSDTLRESFSKKDIFNEQVLSAAEEGNLVFFIGAGVSRLMGIPGWEEFSTSLVKEAFPDYAVQKQILKEIKGSKEKITIAYKEMERQGRKEEFYDCFGKAMTPCKKEDQKKNVYEILSRFDALFLTTNADNLFEDVLGTPACHEDWNVDINHNEPIGKARHLFYLHGHYKKDINIEENNLVFTADKYVKRYNEEKFIDFLQKIFRNKEKVIVFIGYGLNEYELIDYVVTKAGYKNNEPQRIYIIQGFCSNEEVLFQAKKDYFNSLNIGVIPYNMDTKGYDALIDFLENYYETYQKFVIPPNKKDIEDSIKECNESNVCYILRYLSDSALSKNFEKKIADELIKNDYQSWMLALSDKNLFTAEMLVQHLQNKVWPILDVFFEWMKSGSKAAQDIAVNFLNTLDSSHIKLLVETGNSILDKIVAIIMSLDKNHIKKKYISLLDSINFHPNAFLIVVLRNEYIENLVTWSKLHLLLFMKKVFGDVNFEKRHDMDSYAIKEIVKRFLIAVPSKSKTNNIFLEYFKEILIKNAESKNYNTFKHVSNLDNLEKTHDEYYLYTYNAINSFFERLEICEQKEFIKELLNEGISSKKLGLHLARKNKILVPVDLSKIDLYSSHEYYCEFFMYLKFLHENSFLSEKDADLICEQIIKCDWSFYKNGIEREDKYVRYIESKKLAILNLLPGKKSRGHALEISNKDIAPHNPIEVANNCDYVKSVEWAPDNAIDSEKLKTLPVEQWYNELIPIFSIDNTWDSRAAAEQYIKSLSDKNPEEIVKAIESLKNLPISKMGYIVGAIYFKYDSFSVVKESVFNLCIWILDRAEKNIANANLMKETFKLLKKIIDINVECKTAQQLLPYITPWLRFSINIERTFAEEDVLGNLINYGDFDKYLVWIHCLIAIKKQTKQAIGDVEFDLITTLLGEDKGNVFRYTLCYYYSNIKYLLQEKAIEIFERLTSVDTGFDLVALQLCILNSRNIFSEFVEKIVVEYLCKAKGLPKAARNNMVAQHFYSLVLVAWFYGKIDQNDFIKAFEDDEFVQYYFHNLTYLSSEKNFDLEKHISLGWSFLKKENRIEACVKYSGYLLHTMDDIEKPTIGLLDLYLEAAELSEEFSAYSIKLCDVAKFFEVDIVKAHKLAKFVVTKRLFWDDENLKVLLEKYNMNKGTIRFGKELLNLLQDKGIISFDKKDELGKILGCK